MTSAAHFTGLRRHLRGFAGNREGISAVEFALILPFMVFLYIGGVELGDGMSIQYRVTETARTLTDLVSQYVSMDSATIEGVLGASTQVVAPYSAANMIVTISEITTTNSTGSATVTWSCSLNGTARTTGSSYTLPTALDTLPSGTSVILGEVTYPYTPSMGYVITGTINLFENSYFFPRLSNSVTLSSGC
jgi:Flp pilus assembly protein TadG